MSKINFTYKNCNKKDFDSDVAFDEELFVAKLDNLFGTGLQVERINVIFDKNGSSFDCHIHVVYMNGDGFDVDSKNGQMKHASGVVRDAIQKAISKQQRENDYAQSGRDDDFVF